MWPPSVAPSLRNTESIFPHWIARTERGLSETSNVNLLLRKGGLWIGKIWTGQAGNHFNNNGLWGHHRKSNLLMITCNLQNRTKNYCDLSSYYWWSCANCYTWYIPLPPQNRAQSFDFKLSQLFHDFRSYTEPHYNYSELQSGIYGK